MILRSVVAHCTGVIKVCLRQIYDYYAALDSTKKFSFKGMLAFAKAFEISPGLYDMVSNSPQPCNHCNDLCCLCCPLRLPKRSTIISGFYATLFTVGANS